MKKSLSFVVGKGKIEIYTKINNETKPKNEIISHKVNINKNNVVNLGKYNKINVKKNNNEIWSKYYGYFKNLNKK